MTEAAVPMSESPAGKPAGTLLLQRREVAALLDLGECVEAVERAFQLHAQGESLPPGVLSTYVPGGGFHVKAAGLKLERPYFAAKFNGNFSGNASRFGLPNIQGVILLCDAENGCPLALLDSIEITIQRTAAASAVAARYLARPESEVLTVCGCGNQGRSHLLALSRVLSLKHVFAWDADAARAQAFAREFSQRLGVAIEAVEEPHSAARQSDLCVTCTSARRWFLAREDVRPGTFIAAVGADSPDKQEIDPQLMAVSRIVVDSLAQCAEFGELHHALEAGVVTRESVWSELADVVAGRKPGRTALEEIILFDSTGVALEDVAAAVAVYHKALREGAGRRLDFAA
jgi:ornithine cyclodeaminase/alanine dehydrogenase